eukprot:15340511-Ditylum_brightwellii.AAC.1
MIVHYLNSTKDTHPGQKGYCGMIISLTNDLTLDYFVGVKFAGLWGHESDQDSNVIKSHTVFILTLGSMLILWISTLQLDVACSTIEVEYIALAQSMQEEAMSTISTMWEDSNRTLILTHSLMPCMTPSDSDGDIEVEPIDKDF